MMVECLQRPTNDLFQVKKEMTMWVREGHVYPGNVTQCDNWKDKGSSENSHKNLT